MVVTETVSPLEAALRNWLPLVALAIALVGGVPGVIRLLEWLHDRPRFRVSVSATFEGTFDLNGQTVGFIALLVDVTTLGAQALAPNDFTFEWKKHRNWETLRPLVGDFPFGKAKAEFSFLQNPTLNLISFRELIAANDTRRGYLCFATNPDRPGRVLQEKQRLTVIDNLGRKHQWRGPLKGRALQPGQVVPGLGVMKLGDPGIPPLDPEP